MVQRKETENNREYAFRFLRFNILSLRILPGAPIKENEIAAILDISRTPVREAILMLKDQFLVDVLPQSGSAITLVDLGMMKKDIS